MAAASVPRKEHASLADFFALVQQRRLLIAGIALVVVITAALVTAFLPKWYAATATVRVEKPDGEMKLFESSGGAYYDPYFLQDQFRIMQEPKILHPVIERLDLNRRIGAMLDTAEPLPTDITVDVLVNTMLRLDSPRNSSLIKIGVLAQDPALAAAIANEIAQVYSDDRIAFATSAQREGVAQLRKELEVQERNVSAQRDRVEQLRNEMNLAGVDFNARYSDMEIENLRQMQSSLIALRVDAIGRKTRWERFKAIPFEERLNLVNSELINDANILNLLQAFLVADQTVTRLTARLGSAHPDLIAAVDNRAKIREQLDGQLRGFENALEIAYQEAQSRVAALESQLDEAKVAQILSATDRRRPFEEAVRKLDDETRLLTTLKLTLRQREIDFQVPKRSIEILGAAVPPRRPSKPSWSLNLALALMCGLMLGVGVAALVEYVDTSFRNVAEVENRLQLPMLGVVPRRPEAGAEAAAVDTGDPLVAEPLRVLHTNLSLLLPAEGAAVLGVFSAGPGEGKSTTWRGLAQVMAAAGERVLLVDGDLRRPTQHRLAGVDRVPGLGDVLAGRVEFAQAVRRGGVGQLDVLPAGTGEGVIFGRLQTERLRELITMWRGSYDRILFDSPPVIGVSDASVIATLLDGLVLLVQHRRNPQSMVIRAKQVLEAVKVPLLGVVLNQVPTGSSEDYGYYTANYAYYGGGGEKGKNGRARRAPADTPTAKSNPSGPERLPLDGGSG